LNWNLQKGVELILKSASIIMLALLIISTLALAYPIQLVRADGTVTIKADGSIEPPTNITRFDNWTYTFTDNIIGDLIIVQRGNITIDGKGFLVQGSGNGNGFTLNQVNNVTLKNMNIANFLNGIRIDYSNYTFVTENNVTDNVQAGIEISNSHDNAIKDNIASGNNGTGIYIQGSSSDVIEGNTVIGNLGYGIFIYNSPNEEMNNNTVNYNNNNGIYMDTCLNALVNSSIISGNQGTGVFLGYSFIGNVTSNQILGNTANGIWLYRYNTGFVQGNRLENNTIGIYMFATNYFNLTDNYVANQNDCAISMGNYLYPSTGNFIYHNEFVDNKNPINIEANSVASWNDSYPSGGNYWSDYSGNDTKKGPYQNITGQDGIGDTAYVINASRGIVDYYPLSPSTQPSHDIGIFNPAQWKKVVFQGYPLCTYGSVINYGNNTENVSIIAYAKGVPFDCKNLTIQARTWNTAGFTFTSNFGWNTTSLVKGGNYSLSFCVCPVAGETDNSDNNFTDGWVVVSMVGDLTGNTSNPWDFVPDGKVDGKDIAIVALCFGSAPGCSPPYVWNPNCDVNNDGRVDGKDIALIAIQYGQADP
jgi:parallel beta-helix repeat protein